MAQYNFGVGSAYIIPAGASVKATPLGVLQELSFDISFTTKELRGAYSFPVDIATGAGKISGKAKVGTVNGGLLAAALAGSTSSTGQTIGVPGETMSATSTTYTVANPTGFSDIAVKDATGVPLTKVASAPSAGQYSVTTGGVYTFGSTGIYTVVYSYTVAGSGVSINFDNQLMGSSTVFQLIDFNTFRSKNQYLRAAAVIIPKLSIPMKSEDYTISDIDFECFADSSGNVLDISTNE